MQPIYDPEAVRFMWEELESVGFRSLRTADEVEEAIINNQGTTLVVINSVCGCAAGGARPGVMKALQNKIIPDRLITVFAGVDQEAVQEARRRMPNIPPSSPCIALFKNGELLTVLERRHLEKMNPEMISESLCRTFNEHCSAPGPSIPPEEFARINPLDNGCFNPAASVS